MPRSENPGRGAALTITPAPRPATTDTPVGDIGGAVKRAAGGPAPRDAWSVIERAQAGDPDAFAELYTRYRPAILKFIHYRVTHHQLAEDLTQDVFVRALRGITALRWQGTDPGAWFITIARNLILDHYKSARVRTEARLILEFSRDDDPFAAQVDPDPAPDDAAVTAARRATVLAAVRQLPDKQRRVIELRYLADLTIAETCDHTGWTEGVVKALTFRAVRSLRRLIPREAVEAAA